MLKCIKLWGTQRRADTWCWVLGHFEGVQAKVYLVANLMSILMKMEGSLGWKKKVKRNKTKLFLYTLSFGSESILICTVKIILVYFVSNIYTLNIVVHVFCAFVLLFSYGNLWKWNCWRRIFIHFKTFIVF